MDLLLALLVIAIIYLFTDSVIWALVVFILACVAVGSYRYAKRGGRL